MEQGIKGDDLQWCQVIVFGKQQEFHRGGMGRKKGEIHPLRVGHCAQGMRLSLFDLIHPRGFLSPNEGSGRRKQLFAEDALLPQRRAMASKLALANRHGHAPDGPGGSAGLG